jgi:ribosomal protein S18 acetylase RimI-like enzyme
MDYSLIELSQLTDMELQQLAVLHRSVMRSLLSDLGLPFILRYYRIARGDGDALGFCARSASGDVLGWAMGSPHPDGINAQLRSPLTWFLFQMLRLTFTRPIVLRQLISSVVFASRQAEVKPGAIELTYIGVAREQVGRGLGKRLLNAFIDASRSKRYRSVVLSVEKDNLPAISLYEKSGFTTAATFREGRYLRHRMELALG